MSKIKKCKVTKNKRKIIQIIKNNKWETLGEKIKLKISKTLRDKLNTRLKWKK